MFGLEYLSKIRDNTANMKKAEEYFHSGVEKTNSGDYVSHMKCFIVTEQPKSQNSFGRNRRLRYYHMIQAAFLNYFPVSNCFNIDLYGAIYYFFKENVNVDVDNIGKPIWDALKNHLYDDDKLIKLSIAGSIDLNKDWFSIIDFTGIPNDILLDLLDAFDREKHIIYIECGALNPNLIRFNLE